MLQCSTILLWVWIFAHTHHISNSHMHAHTRTHKGFFLPLLFRASCDLCRAGPGTPLSGSSSSSGSQQDQRTSARRWQTLIRSQIYTSGYLFFLKNKNKKSRVWFICAQGVQECGAIAVFREDDLRRKLEGLRVTWPRVHVQKYVTLLKHTRTRKIQQFPVEERGILCVFTACPNTVSNTIDWTHTHTHSFCDSMKYRELSCIQSS